MKRLSLLLLASVLLAVPALAAVRKEHHFALTFSAKAPAKATGTTFLTDRFNYKAPPPGTLADRVASVTFVMAPGTKTNTAAYPACTKAVLETGPDNCPKGSKVGSGQAYVITGLPALDGAKGVPLKATIFAAKGGLLTYLTGAQTQIIQLTMKGNRMVAPVPHVCPTGDCSQVEAVLKYLKVTLKPGNLITTPKKCPASGKWTNTAIYKFVNGDTEKETSTSKCKG